MHRVVFYYWHPELANGAKEFHLSVIPRRRETVIFKDMDVHIEGTVRKVKHNYRINEIEIYLDLEDNE